jgi:hypothetical protein
MHYLICFQMKNKSTNKKHVCYSRNIKDILETDNVHSYHVYLDETPYCPGLLTGSREVVTSYYFVSTVFRAIVVCGYILSHCYVTRVSINSSWYIISSDV